MNEVAIITAYDSRQADAALRQWLEQIVATLPEARQRMYDLFVARGLDSRKAARELGTSVAEVRRLRSENQQAIVRAFEVTALAAAETGGGPPGIEASGCGELRQLLADARHDDGDPDAGDWRHTVVLPAALRLTVSRHLAECRACQDRRDGCMAWWAPKLLPILADAERRERVLQDAQSMRQPGVHRRGASAGGVARTVVIRRPVAAATGAGLLAALLLLAFVWPGVLHWTGGSTAPSSQDRDSAATSSGGAPTVTGTFSGVPGRNPGRQVRPGAAGLLSTRPPTPGGNSAASSSASVQPSAYYTLPPSAASAPSPAQPSSGPSSTGSAATPSPATSSSPSQTTSPTPSASPTTSTPTPSASPTTSAPTPSASPTTSTPTASASPATSAPAPSSSASAPAPTVSASDPSSASPTASASAPSASATS